MESQERAALYMPAAEGKVLSRETFWSMIPGFDIEKERDNYKNQQKEDEASQIRVDKASSIRSQSDIRQDTGQQSTGNRRFNNTPG